MEASGATQGETDAAPSGNGFVVIVNQYEPGAIVRLFRVDSDTILRAEGGVQVDERVVDQYGEVGFSGLTPGERFIAAGFSRGRYEEVRAVAQDPSSNIELLQPAVQASPQTIGTQETDIVAVPAAPSDAASTLGVGIPDEVTSPLLSERATPTPPEARADAEVTPGDVEGVAGPTAPVTTDGSGETAGTDAPAQEPAAAPEPPTEPEAAPAPEATPAPAPPEAPPAQPESQPAPVTEPNPPAPEAGTPDASDSSGTGQANGGAVEESKEAAPSEVEFHSGVTPPPAVVEPAPAVEAAPAADPSVPAVEPQPTPEPQPVPDLPLPVLPEQAAAEGRNSWTALVRQAEGLGIANANTLQDAELRQAISEKNVTPVA